MIGDDGLRRKGAHALARSMLDIRSPNLYFAQAVARRKPVAHHASAKKRIRQSERRRTRNRLVLTTVRTQIKKLRRAIEGGQRDEAQRLLPGAIRGLHKAVTKGGVHWKTAGRTVSRLVRAVSALA
jgi:small subunit ribosomal protein S20